MAVDDENIKFSDLYTIITGTAHDGNQSISLSDFRGEGSVPTTGFISINSHFKGQTFSSNDFLYEYDSKTFVGDARASNPNTYTGLSKTNVKSEQYSESPISWNGKADIIEINASIVKNSNCNDHFFIFTDKTSKPNWSWGSTSEEYKIVWNCSNLYIYYPESSTYTSSASSYRTYELKIVKADDTIKVYLDNATSPVLQCPLNGNLNDSFKIWIGADADSSSEAALFNNVTAKEEFLTSNTSIITSYGADDFAYINCSSVSDFNNKTFQEYISSFGITGSSSNNNTGGWPDGYSGLLNYDFRLPSYTKDYFKYDGDYGLRFIHGDGSSDGRDWVVIDFGPKTNYDFDGYYRNTKGRYFGGEYSYSGGGAGFYSSSSNKGMLWGFNGNEGWKLLYQLPLGVSSTSFTHGNGNWFNTGGTLVTSGDGKRAEYDTMKLTAVGFSVASAVTP
tara:strand:- start:7837 stop:9183 length:1347 start_codon:yes stop_codon:yes gene_type:complete